MKAVGIRELKDHLSRYIDEVRMGEEVLITDCGEVVASLGPAPRSTRVPDMPAGLVELARRGVVVLGESGPPHELPLFENLTRPGLAAQLLDAERGET